MKNENKYKLLMGTREGNVIFYMIQEPSLRKGIQVINRNEGKKMSFLGDPQTITSE